MSRDWRGIRMSCSCPGVKGAAGIDWSATTVTLISVVIVFQVLHQRASCKKETPLQISSHEANIRTAGKSYKLRFKQVNDQATVI